MLVLPAQQASAAVPASDPAPLSEAQQALAKAKETGRRVEVLGERSERSTVYANPDGDTFTLEESAVPVRVGTPDGGWQAPDATLERRSDGSVGPKAAAVRIALSSGGDKSPLAVIEDEGRSLELQWPGALPAPQLDGPNALYPEVLPGVDLKVTTTPESLQQVFVVKTPEAATNDQLKKLTFGMKSDGLKIHKGVSGNLTAVDGNGGTVFRAPPARMWDSAGADEPTGTQTQLARLETSGATAAEPSDPSETAPSGSGLEPGQGDKVARMDVQVTEDSLSVVPAPEMLTQTEASAFPLFIDPPVTWGSSERTLLRSDGYESYGWSNGDDGQGKGAGKCGTWKGYYCGPGYVQKLYFEFSPAKLAGKKVLDATFRVTEPWAFQCAPRWVDLVRTNNISSSTTWSTRPTELDWMVDRYVSAGRGSLCDPDAPDAPIEFHDNPEETNENLTPTVQAFAQGKFSRLTLAVRAHDESDTSAWKRFKNDAVLAVTFVGLPAKPTGLGLATGTGTSCMKDVSKPAIVSDPAPLLRAVAQTQPGGEANAQLRVYFDLDHRNPDGTWTDTPAGNGSLAPAPTPVKDDQLVSLKWSNLTDGKLYRYHAWTWSYYNNGSSYLSSEVSDGFCYFRVDSQAPKPPQITLKSPYSECGTTCAAQGGPGTPVTFTLSPNTAEDSTVVSYEYTLLTGDWSTGLVSSGSTVTVPIDRSGTYILRARGVDNIGAGRTGTFNQIQFLVAPGAGPVGRWQFEKFDQETGAAVDSAAGDGVPQYNATLAGDAAPDDRGRRGELKQDGSSPESPIADKGLSLNGSSAYASAEGQVVDTRASYTVSAWAMINPGATGNRTVLGQDGDFYSGFYLSYQSALGTWSLRTSPRDDSSGNIVDQTVVAKQPATPGVWTHLAAVYDAPAKQIRLYVNGKLQGSDSVEPSWQAAGPLQIGRVVWHGSYVDYFPGSIDEVAAWQRALSEAEIADEARLAISDGFNSVELVADWQASQSIGGTIQDTAGYGRSLTLTGGASLDGETILLDGAGEAATAAGPIVDDTGSFTVTTLASVNADTLAGKGVGYTGQVLGQKAADGSAWNIWFELTDLVSEFDDAVGDERLVPYGKWHFGRLNADGTSSSVVSARTPLPRPG